MKLFHKVREFFQNTEKMNKLSSRIKLGFWSAKFIKEVKTLEWSKLLEWVFNLFS